MWGDYCLRLCYGGRYVVLNNNGKNCLFHIPMFIENVPGAGSRVRPLKLQAALQEIGYQVDTIWGYGAQRKKIIESVKDKIRQGTRYDFLYSESSTMPTILTEKSHLPIYPFLDFSFFNLCSKNHIPIGLFYRDIHWRFEAYRQQVAWYKRLFTIPFYYIDLLLYRFFVDVLFLPSQRMSAYIPCGAVKFVEDLPPGAEIFEEDGPHRSDDKLRLLYVGGVYPPLYDISNLLKGVYFSNIRGDEVNLTICCPEAHWQTRPRMYDCWLGSWVKIVHLTGAKVQQLYKRCDVAMVYLKPFSYLEFAMPVKVFEALGHGKPIITMYGTVVADLIQDEGWGWSISPEPKSLTELLGRLIEMPEEITKKTDLALEFRHHHSWPKRAEKVAETLTCVD
jgi:glycosyltransferase involved in cell wall biosynthesis